MTHIFLNFREANQIVDFVRLMDRCDYPVDVKCGSRTVNAKSLVGVMSLAGMRSLELVPHTDHCEELLEKLAPYAA